MLRVTSIRQDPTFFGKIPLFFSARGGPFVAEHPFIDLAKVDFPAAARRRAGGPDGFAEIAWVDNHVLEIRRNGSDESSANEETRKCGTTCPRDRAQHRVAQCCIRGLLYHRRECRGPWTAGVCPGEHLRILHGPHANQWIVHGRGPTGPGLRLQPCRAAVRFRHLGPVKGPPHHFRRSVPLAGGTHPPAATAYDRR